MKDAASSVLEKQSMERSEHLRLSITRYTLDLQQTQIPLVLLPNMEDYTHTSSYLVEKERETEKEGETG